MVVRVHEVGRGPVLAPGQDLGQLDVRDLDQHVVELVGALKIKRFVFRIASVTQPSYIFQKFIFLIHHKL